MLNSILVVACACLLVNAPDSGQADRPNILLIMVDDLGCVDLQGEGHEVHLTPNLDELRRGSVRFTNAFCNAPNCAPSRAALMTGRHGARTGVFTVGSAKRGKDPERRVEPPKNQTTLDNDEFTLGEALQMLGYHTAYVGKWHLGEDPTTQGFTVNVGGTRAGHPKSYFSPYRNAALEDGPEGEYLVDRLANETVAIIEGFEEVKSDDGEAFPDRPWFVMWAPYAVHTPIQAVPEETAAIKARHPGMNDRKARYAAMVEATDRAVGKVLSSIDDDDTMVIFLSDNGGLNGITDSRPWRGGKGMLYEGGIRTPLYVRGPGLEPREVGTPVQAFDLFPTLIEYAGSEVNPDHPVDGRSLLGALQGEALDQTPLFWHFPAYLEGRDNESHDPDRRFRTTPCGAIRDGDWKLIEYFEDGEVELFNLAQDGGETRDLSSEDPERVAALQSRLEAWRKGIGAPMPTAKPVPVIEEAPTSDAK